MLNFDVKYPNPFIFSNKDDFIKNNKDYKRKPEACKNCPYYKQPTSLDSSPGNAAATDIMVVADYPREGDIDPKSYKFEINPFSGSDWWIFKKILNY